MHDHSSSHLSSLRLRKRRLVKRAGAAGLALVLCAFGFLYVWQRVQVIKIGYEIMALKKEKEALATINKSLLIETATLTSPERIETIASKDIGMRSPAEGQIVMVRRAGGGASAKPDNGARQAKRQGGGPGKS